MVDECPSHFAWLSYNIIFPRKHTVCLFCNALVECEINICRLQYTIFISPGPLGRWRIAAAHSYQSSRAFSRLWFCLHLDRQSCANFPLTNFPHTNTQCGGNYLLRILWLFAFWFNDILLERQQTTTTRGREDSPPLNADRQSPSSHFKVAHSQSNSIQLSHCQTVLMQMNSIWFE